MSFLKHYWQKAIRATAMSVGEPNCLMEINLTFHMTRYVIKSSIIVVFFLPPNLLKKSHNFMCTHNSFSAGIFFDYSAEYSTITYALALGGSRRLCKEHSSTLRFSPKPAR